MCNESSVVRWYLIWSASLPALLLEPLSKLASSNFYLGVLPPFSFRLTSLQLGTFMNALKKLKAGQIPSVIGELGPGKNLAPERKSSIQLSWLSFQLCQGSVLAISLPNASLETLQAFFFFCLFFSWGAVC